MISIDGSHGEGGGQILRSALALSIITQKPFSIVKIRAKRERPGLLRQHLTAVDAAVTISNADASGVALGSTELRFAPRGIHPGAHRFAIGTAGSASLVLQTILLPLAHAKEPSVVIVEGGTHNPSAPPFGFLARSYLPLLAKMGVTVDAKLERAGFMPRGGGRIRVHVEPGTLGSLELEDRGRTLRRRAISMIARLPDHVAERELSVLASRLALRDDETEIVRLSEGEGPGNAAFVELAYEYATIVLTGFGEKGKPAETVAHELADDVVRFERAAVAVDAHLADQLLLPLALGRGGSFTTTEPTEHARTHADVIRMFLGRETRFDSLGDGAWRVSVSA